MNPENMLLIVTRLSKTFAETKTESFMLLLLLFLNDSPRGTYFKKGKYKIQINANWKKFGKGKNYKCPINRKIRSKKYRKTILTRSERSHSGYND